MVQSREERIYRGMAVREGMKSFSLCNLYTNTHVWIWGGGNSWDEPDGELRCSCGAIRYKNRNSPEKEFDELHWDYDRYDETPENGMIT